MNELVALIDRAVCFVRERGDYWTEDEIAEFNRTAAEVYRLAFPLDLTAALPQQAELRSRLDAHHLPPPQFEGKLNLPAERDREGGGFVVSVTDRWLADMAMLRELAAETPPAQPAPVQPVSPPTVGITLPWSDEELERLTPLGRRLLRHMWGRERAELRAIAQDVWKDEEMTSSAYQGAQNDVNAFLEGRSPPHQRRLSKIRGEEAIRWRNA